MELPPELLQKFFSYLDQGSTQAAARVCHTWRANVIRRANTEKALVEKQVKFISENLDNSKYVAIITACGTILKQNPVSDSLDESQSKNSWLHNVKVFFAEQLKTVEDTDLQQLDYNLQESAYFSDLPTIANIYKELDKAETEQGIARSNAFQAIAYCLSNMGEFFDDAVDIAKKIPDAEIQSYTLYEVIDRAKLKVNYEKLLNAAKMISNPHTQSNALFNIVLEILPVSSDAQTVAYEITNMITDERTKNHVLFLIKNTPNAPF